MRKSLEAKKPPGNCYRGVKGPPGQWPSCWNMEGGREGREVKQAGLELSSPKSCSLELSIGSQRTFQAEESVDKGLEVEKYVLCLGNSAGTARK